MKKTEIIFFTILVPLDYILLLLAGLSAYGLRYSNFYKQNIRGIVFNLPLIDYFQYVALFAVVWIIIFALSGLYAMGPSRKLFDVINKIVLACSTGTLLVIVVFFFSRELFSSRFIILAAWVLSITYISIAHILLSGAQRWFYKKGHGVHRVVLIGKGELSKELEKIFQENRKYGYEVVYISPGVDEILKEKLGEWADKGEVDEIIQVDPNLSRDKVLELIDLADEYHIDFRYAADTLGAERINIDIKMINGIPFVEIKKTPLDGWGRVAKRIFDVVGSILALVIFSPIFLLTILAIKIDSRGPIIYKSKRVGARGKIFFLYKFRSMIVGAEKIKESLAEANERADGPLFKMENDPRITRVGKFIRRTSIDEFPNFWNVLIGNMSLVGPRPHEPHEVARYEKHHKKLLNIKPGITGMAQVSGRSTLDFESEARLDMLYIERWSLKQDILILMKTPWVVLFAKTAS